MELEYRYALEQGMAVLTFMVGEHHNFSVKDFDLREGHNAKQKLADFKNEISQRREVWYFNSIEELQTQVRSELERIVIYNVADAFDKKQESNGGFAEQTYAIPTLPQMYCIPPYILTHKFIGRRQELEELNDWAVSEQPIMVVQAIGGMGKSALCWEWVKNYALHTINPAGTIWWSFYDRGATIESFVRHALAYITQQNPENLKKTPYQEQISTLLILLEKSNYLLILDGLERILVAYHRIDRAHVRDHQIKDDLQLRDCTDPRDAETLRLLTSLNKSKVLISTRLMPASLEVTSRPIFGVRLKILPGLSLEDARKLLVEQGVKNASLNIVNDFLRKINCHGLLVKIIAGVVKEYRPAPGDFDQWYQRIGAELNITELAVDDRHSHILKYAIEGIDEDKRLILSRIATFSDPVSYRTLSIINPYLPMKPLPPRLPSIPQTVPSPFGTPQLAWLKYQLSREADISKIEALKLEIQHQEVLDAKISQDIIVHKRELEKEERRIIHDRNRILNEFEQEYQTSKAYLDSISAFDSALTELEGRGLLQWDKENNSYDLHPVVRGYAYSLLPPAERITMLGKIRDYFASIPIISDDKINELPDIEDMIAAYRALVGTGEINYAAEYYRRHVGHAVHRLSAPYVTIEMLRPLFTKGLDQLPPLDNSETQAHIVNDLALAFKATGDLSKAKILFTLNLGSTQTTRWNKYIDVSNFCQILLDLNQISHASYGYELAAQIIDENNIAWSYFDLLSYYILTGQWENAQKYYQCYIESSQPHQHAGQLEVLVACRYARMEVYQNHDAEAALQSALQKIGSHKQLRYKSNLLTLWAEWRLLNYQLEVVQDFLNEAISLERSSGTCSANSFSIFSRLEAMQGNKESAIRHISSALADPKLTEGMKADVYANIAQTYLILKDLDRAQQYAELAYKYSCADGEPHIRFWPLHKAKIVLDSLERPHPDIPPPTLLPDKIPHEDEIRETYIAKNGLAKLPKQPNSQETFKMTKFTWVQLGTLAFFGIENDDLINQISLKLTAISYLPTPIRFSKMGEEVPEPITFQIDIERVTFDHSNFTFEEIRCFQQTFAILYLESTNSSAEQVYAYVNVRIDRLKRLLDQGELESSFDIAEYCTIVKTGNGRPSIEERERLQRDYLFGEFSLNVRLFPPLAEVT